VVDFFSTSNDQSPTELFNFLDRLVSSEILNAVMIWGPPGIGKSSVVAQVASKNQMQLVDIRISQLAPTDLRGLPVPEIEKGLATWYPPSFLPRDPNSKGILFLDEINMAPPVVQGIAQQLVLDRKIGDYELPKGWFIWAAGNRKSDGASVYEMKSPLANRFIHLSARPDMDSFVDYMASSDFTPEVLAFVMSNSDLLHKMPSGSGSALAWPSPRMWDEADKLHFRKLPIEPAVGRAAHNRFATFLQNVSPITDEILDKIRTGDLEGIPYPSEDSPFVSGRVENQRKEMEDLQNAINNIKEERKNVSQSRMPDAELNEAEKKLVREMTDSKMVNVSEVVTDQRVFLSVALAMAVNSKEEATRFQGWLRKNAPSTLFQKHLQVLQPAMRAKKLPMVTVAEEAEAKEVGASVASSPEKKPRATKKKA